MQGSTLQRPGELGTMVYFTITKVTVHDNTGSGQIRSRGLEAQEAASTLRERAGFRLGDAGRPVGEGIPFSSEKGPRTHSEFSFP